MSLTPMLRSLLISIAATVALVSTPSARAKGSSAGYHSPNASASHSSTYGPYGYSSKGGQAKVIAPNARARNWAAISTGASVIGGAGIKTTTPLLFRTRLGATPTVHYRTAK